MIELKDPWDWKAKYERAEDRGNAPDLANVFADVQEDAINATLKLARKKMRVAIKGLPRARRTEILNALKK